MRSPTSPITDATMTTAPQPEPRIREVHAKSILNKSGIADWTINCYAGCQHACHYCYARFATRFSHPGEPWGSFVDVKVNAAELLAREVRRKRIGRVFVSSVCDGWQPLEERYGLTRGCLEILLRCGFPVTILTKSALAHRDFDLLAGKDGVEFGVTITTLDEDISRLIEPAGSRPAERLGLLEEATRRGIRTYAFVGPLMPHLSDTEENVTRLLKRVREVGADYFYVDRLNPRYGVWQSLMIMLQAHFPQLVETYRHILFNARFRMEHSRRLASAVHQVARREGIAEKMRLCF